MRQPFPWMRWVVGVMAVGLLGFGIYYIASDVDANPQGEVEPPPGVEEFGIPEFDHTEGPVVYEQDPPAGGPHAAASLACAAYDEPVRNENAVHALEHGAVWITYRPGLDPGDVEDLEGYVGRGEIIVSPYPGLDSAVVLTSWGRQLALDGVDGETILQFIRAFKNRTAPENNATC